MQRATRSAEWDLLRLCNSHVTAKLLSSSLPPLALGMMWSISSLSRSRLNGSSPMKQVPRWRLRSFANSWILVSDIAPPLPDSAERAQTEKSSICVVVHTQVELRREFPQLPVVARCLLSASFSSTLPNVTCSCG